MKQQCKQMLCLLLMAALILTLAACGGKDDAAPTTAGSVESTTQSTKPTDSPVEGGTKKTISATLWDLTYDEADGWVYNEEEDLNNGETYSTVYLRIPKPENEEAYSVHISIQVMLGEPYSFRDHMVQYGFDEYEYEVNHSYPLTNLGGLDCLACETTSWGSPTLYYLGRDESSTATLYVEVSGEYADVRVENLLSGLQLKLTDIGNVDGPWYWEGESFSGEAHEVMVGTRTLNSTWIPFQDGLRTYETFDHAVAVYGEVAYLLCDGALTMYAYDGASLSYPREIPLEDEYIEMNLDNSGNLWLSRFGSPLISLAFDQKVASYDDPDYVAMAPSGTWGISWFTRPECEKLVLNDGILTIEAITFAELSMVSKVFIDENNIYVCGSAVDGTGHKVFVYDYDGNYKLELADEDGSGLGSITFVAETDNGFLALDGNMREVVLWNKDGLYIGAADDGDLFGTSYPWFCGACKLDDGSFLVLMTEKRADKSATEVVAFRLSGF